MVKYHTHYWHLDAMGQELRKLEPWGKPEVEEIWLTVYQNISRSKLPVSKKKEFATNGKLPIRILGDRHGTARHDPIQSTYSRSKIETRSSSASTCLVELWEMSREYTHKCRGSNHNSSQTSHCRCRYAQFSEHLLTSSASSSTRTRTVANKRIIFIRLWSLAAVERMINQCWLPKRHQLNSKFAGLKNIRVHHRKGNEISFSNQLQRKKSEASKVLIALYFL